MARVHRSIEIKAPVKDVYTYVDDPKTSPEWIVGMVEVHNVKGSGVGQHYDWTFNMAGIRLKGETTCTEDVPEKHIVVQSKGGVESTWTFDLKQRENATVLDLDIDYKIPVPVLGKLAEKVLLKRNERQTEMALMNIKEKMEAH